MLISPNGDVIKEVLSDKISMFKSTINLDDVSNWFISQCRNDVIKLTE